ncbi:MAG TPA: hypothetical protein VFQ45_15415 [Longimicrobium sp.]|nr:hypothetical protein [Longimicrobium sp.]
MTELRPRFRMRLWLSTTLTPWIKGLGLAFVAVMGAVMAGVEGGGARNAGAAAAMVAVAAWGLLPLCSVQQVGYTLVLTRWFREVAVPMEQVQRVTAAWWARPGAITLVFHEPTPFGRHVSFVPPIEPLDGLPFLRRHDVADLRRMVREAHQRAAQRNPQPRGTR